MCFVFLYSPVKTFILENIGREQQTKEYCQLMVYYTTKMICTQLFHVRRHI